MSATNRHRPPAHVQASLLDVGARAPGRHPEDFYATPAWCTEAILPHLPVMGPILDPSCGDGAILAVCARLLLAPKPTLMGVELDPERAATARAKSIGVVVTDDFLYAAGQGYGRSGVGLILGNPPFSLAMEFVEACLRLAVPTRATVAMLLRLAFLESIERAAFHTAHPADIYPLAKRPSFTGDGTDSAACAWFVWGPGRGGRWFAPLGGTAAPREGA